MEKGGNVYTVGGITDDYPTDGQLMHGWQQDYVLKSFLAMLCQCLGCRETL